VSEPVDRLQAFARAALPGLGVGPRAALALLEISENATFAVDDPDHEPSVLRVYRAGYQSVEAIRSELAWIQALRAEAVVDTPAPLPAADGELVVEAVLPDGERRHVVRFEWVDGAEPDPDRRVGDFVTLGAIAARLHRHTRAWALPPGFTRFVWDVDAALGERALWGRWQEGLGVGTAERALLGRAADRIVRRLASFGCRAERFGLIHADMRLANLLVSGDRVVVIDFDDCGFGWFGYDLAAALSFIEHQSMVPELIAAWLDGYRRVAPFAAADEAELATLIMLRRMLLVAWIGTHATTDTAIATGPTFTADTCDLAERYLAGTLFR
jgi:Ser/Thr protein kinase RdoA (MazF antagonist)